MPKSHNISLNIDVGLNSKEQIVPACQDPVFAEEIEVDLTVDVDLKAEEWTITGVLVRGADYAKPTVSRMEGDLLQEWIVRLSDYHEDDINEALEDADAFEVEDDGKEDDEAA